MKRFRFPLERVLRQRTLQEETAEQALGVALQREHAAEDACGRVRGEIRQEAMRLSRRLVESMDGREWLICARYAAALQTREARLQQEQFEARTRSEKRRKELLERRRAREVVTQLRRGAWERYREATAHEEQAALDELAGQRHAHRHRESEG